MKIFYLILMLAFSLPLYSQTEYERWGKADVSYTPNRARHTDSEGTEKSFNLLDVAASAYGFFISDLDGDNCPFSPTCSAFFLQSAKKAGIFQGALMFADRFIRDINIVKKNHYPFTGSFRLYDPADNYLLRQHKIKYIPPSDFVNE